MTFGLELDHVDAPDGRRNAVDDDTAAVTHDQHRLDAGTGDDGERREPEFPAEAGRRAGNVDQRLRQPVGAQHQGAVLFEDDDGGRSTHIVVAQHAGGPDVEGRGAQQPVGCGSAKTEPHCEADQRRGGAPGERCARDRQAGEQSEQRIAEHGYADGTLETQLGNEYEPRQQRARDRTDRVPRVDTCRGTRSRARLVCQDAHRQWKSRADEERRREQHDDRHGHIAAQAGVLRDQRIDRQVDGDGAPRDGDLRDDERHLRDAARARQRRGDGAACGDTEQETRHHGGECIDAAAEHEAEHPCPQHLVDERDRAGCEHHRQDPVTAEAEALAQRRDRGRGTALGWHGAQARPGLRTLRPREQRCNQEDSDVDAGTDVDGSAQTEVR